MLEHDQNLNKSKRKLCVVQYICDCLLWTIKLWKISSEGWKATSERLGKKTSQGQNTLPKMPSKNPEHECMNMVCGVP